MKQFGHEVRIVGLPGLPEIVEGDDLASMIVSAAGRAGWVFTAGDVVVIAQKVVSKAEGRTVCLDSIRPSALALEWASRYDRDPRLVEIALGEAARVVRMDHGVLITQTRHGFVCANSGVDMSNTPDGTATLLPIDPDLSARRIRDALKEAVRADLAVIISDTFGRPWREGLVNVALGVAGLAPLLDYRGQNDWCGHPLRVTTIATADEVASAAELVMGKTIGVPVAVARGIRFESREGSSAELIRESQHDLFR